jgi:hypothetical protein
VFRSSRRQRGRASPLASNAGLWTGRRVKQQGLDRGEANEQRDRAGQAGQFVPKPPGHVQQQDHAERHPGGAQARIAALFGTALDR